MARFHATDKGNIPFTEEEEITADAQKAQYLQEQPKILAKEKIAAIEATITPRRQREAILGTDNGWLADQEAAIAALRAQL